MNLLTTISTECKIFMYFRVTFLLDQSAFLSPKLFYYISINWNKIMEMVMNQFKIDQDQNKNQKISLKRETNLNKDLNRLQIA